jgi:capsular exopolysaccharide synthesis family protein
MQEPISNKSELWSLSLRDLFYKYVRFLPFFVLSVAIFLFGAYIYLRYTTRIYSASGTMLIKSEQQTGRSDKFEEIFSSNKTLNIQSEMEILRSKPLMERVVTQLNLHATYLSKGRFITTNIYKYGPFLLQVAELTDSSSSFTLNIRFLDELRFRVNNEPAVFRFDEFFKNAYGVFRLVRNPNIPVGKEYIVEWRSASAAASSLVGSVQVVPRSSGTGILTVSFQGTNPQMCADIVNKLMEEYEGFTIEQKNISADQSLIWIDGRMKLIGRELDSVQNLLLDYQQRNNLIDIESQSSLYFNKINEADKTINENMVRISMVDMLNDYLRDSKTVYSKVPSSLGLEDPALAILVAEYNKAQIDRKTLINGNVPEGNPIVKELDAHIEKMRLNIQERLRTLRSTYGTLIANLKTQSGSAQYQAQQLPIKTKKYLELKRQVETKEGLFTILQAKREETAIGRASTISNSKTIDKAYASAVPIKPNSKSIRIMAILLGLALPAMFIFLTEVLNDKISTRYDIEKITPAPILGEIGHAYSKNPLVVTKTTRSMVAEQFRIIRSNLQYIINNVDKSVIVVTSSFSGEGKSFVTMNMGAVLALADKKTIILEFDIRKPKILSGLNLPKGPGLTNFLVGKARVEELVTPVPGFENLYVMSSGPIPPNPSELMLGQKVTDLFAYLRQHFDVVLVDTAPVGMVSDAQTLGKFADCTLYLVRQGHTFKKQVALIDEFYQLNKLPKVSIILNDVKVKPGYGYYGYGRYGYGYGYGYGYYDEEVPPASKFEKIFGWLNFRRMFGGIKKRSRQL